MGNMKRWRQIGQGEFQKWTEPGQTLEGIWEGQHDGQFGPLGIISQPNGSRITFPIHTALVDKLAEIKEGAEIKIIYTGKRTSKTGREFKGFDVFAEDTDNLPQSDSDLSDEPPDKEVPF